MSILNNLGTNAISNKIRNAIFVRGHLKEMIILSFTWKQIILDKRNCSKSIAKKQWFVQLIYAIYLSVQSFRKKLWAFKFILNALIPIMRVNLTVEMEEKREELKVKM